MHEYKYKTVADTLLTADIVSMLTKIHEYKGEQNLFIEAKSDILTKLVEIAKIQSTESSNKIEGIYTSDERIKKLITDKTTPRTRDEQEIAGYRDVLSTIHDNFDFIPPKPTMILQLHRDLYKFSGLESGGKYKTGDNIIAETDSEGNKFVRFKPVSAWETPDEIARLCENFEREITGEQVDPLLLIPMFILDFLCIHPFNDGNGRMSRLLTLLLLYRSGYIVGKYISIEKLIEETKDTYYDALQRSSTNWHENNNDYAPFARYMLGILLGAYREFETRVKTFVGVSKNDRIREILRETLGKITKKELLEKCPDISKITVERTLREMVQSGEIIKISGGRYTAYTWNRDKE